MTLTKLLLQAPLDLSKFVLKAPRPGRDQAKGRVTCANEEEEEEEDAKLVLQ